MEGIEISTWEDVGGGEGRGSADTMEQENLVLRGDEQDARARLRNSNLFLSFPIYLRTTSR